MPKHKRKGPISLRGAPHHQRRAANESAAVIPLRVQHRDADIVGHGLLATVHPDSLNDLCSYGTALPDLLFLQLARGSDCVLPTRADSSCPVGFLQLDQVQQANLRLCPGELYDFRVFDPAVAANAAAATHDDTSIDDGSSAADSSDVHMMAADEDDDGGSVDGSDGGSSSHGKSSSEMVLSGTPAVAAPQLTALEAEVQLMHSSGSSSNSSGSGDAMLEVDALDLADAFKHQCKGHVLAVNQYVAVPLLGCPQPLLLRVTRTDWLSDEQQRVALCYHCFRGVLSDSTLVYLTSAYCEPVPVPVPPSSPQPATAVTTVPEQASAAWSQAQQQQLSLQQSQQHLLQQQQQQLGEVQHRLAAVTLVADTAVREPSRDQQLAAARTVQSRLAGATGTARLRLLNAPRRAEAPLARDVVHVHTNDGEWFPVAKRLLRPCISLTKAVRDSGVTSPAVHVDIDTCTMDRVLLFLEAAATQRQPPRFAAHMLCDLARAAEQLGLRSLVRYCAALQGSRAALLGVYTFAQVQAANAAGKVWLILDGMVLDVGRWLPEHPGGAAIIPAQALNVDCGRFFEMFHATRESFMYLEDFYIGELAEEDRSSVPLGGGSEPSDDFVAALGEYTAFRMDTSSPRVSVHLGAPARRELL